MTVTFLRRLPGVIGVAVGVAVLVIDARVGAEGDGAPLEGLARRWPVGWVDSPVGALRLARERDALVLVYAFDGSFACRALEEAAGADALVGEALAAFVPLAVYVESGGDTLGITGAPLLGVLSLDALEARLVQTEDEHGGLELPLIPITGGLYEPIGIAAELTRLSDPEGRSLLTEDDLHAEGASAATVLALIARHTAAGNDRQAEAAFDDALARETQPNGIFHRFALLREAIRTHTVDGPADGEGTIEAALLVEEDARVLYHGWSLLGSVFALRARAAAEAVTEANKGAYRDVDATRWRRRMRSASRQAWISCPDELVVPFGSLLIGRYGEAPDELDSLDRMFCRAVLRTLQREAPEHPRVVRATEIVGALR